MEEKIASEVKSYSELLLVRQIITGIFAVASIAFLATSPVVNLFWSLPLAMVMAGPVCLFCGDDEHHYAMPRRLWRDMQ